MPRPARLHLPGFPQHITQRGNKRQAYFYADDDYWHYLELLLAAILISFQDRFAVHPADSTFEILVQLRD